MKKVEENKKVETIFKKDGMPFMRTFSSQEEAELFRLKEHLNRTDMEKFQLLCRMIRIGKMLSPKNIAGK